MITEGFLKRVLVFIGVILSGLITLIFISTPESLDVPVPNQIPSITTKSSQNRELDEAKKYFESSLASELPGASLVAVVSWAPNGKYILANMRFDEKNGNRTMPYILDLGAKKYIPVPNANWIDVVSWSDDVMTYPAQTGYAIFDIQNSTGRTFGSLVNGGRPVFSGDGSYIAYPENGIVLFSTKTNKSIRLTTDMADTPALWKNDSKAIVIFRAGDTTSSASLVEMQIGTRESTQLATLPQLAVDATWVIKDQLAKITLGFDDGYFDYAFDFTDNSLKLLAETTEGIAFTSVGPRAIATFKGNRISLYDSRAMKISETRRTERSRVVNFSLLSQTTALLIRESDTGYEAATFNLISGAETPVEEMWLPYAVIAPNNRSAVTVPEGNDRAQFIELPPLS
jgi:hypothetical protein